MRSLHRAHRRAAGAILRNQNRNFGRQTQRPLSKYRVLRFGDMPQSQAVLADAGATPIVLSPALGNAVFNATGQRIRSLPLALNGLKLG